MKETKLEIPADCEVDKIETQDGHIVVTFKEKERKLPKSFDEFCKMFPVPFAFRPKCDPLDNRRITTQVNIPCVMADFTDDPEISDAVIALIKLIQLRNAYNGDWTPDWTDDKEEKYTIEFMRETTIVDRHEIYSISPLYFKTAELRDEFLRCFLPLVEKLKPLYGIKPDNQQ